MEGQKSHLDVLFTREIICSILYMEQGGQTKFSWVISVKEMVVFEEMCDYYHLFAYL